MSILLDGTQGIDFNDGSNQSTAATPYARKNLIINGDMRIDQRNAGASVTPSNFNYLTDRWQYRASQSSKFDAQQSTTVPSGHKNSLLFTSSSAYSVASGEQFGVRQFIEGLNMSHLQWGTANAKTVTLSFWVRSSLTGTHSGALGNNGDARAYPFSYTISSADTWEQKSITIAGDTSGTWLTTNGIGMKVSFNLGSGSTMLATAGAWTTGEIVGVTGSVSVVGTSGATFYITGIQLEVNDSASDFEFVPFDMELARCQRYYYKLVSGTQQAFAVGVNVTTALAGAYIKFPTSMRSTPSGDFASGTDYYQFERGGGSDPFNSFIINRANTEGCYIYNGSEISGTAGQAGWMYTKDNSAAYIGFTSEL